MKCFGYHLESFVRSVLNGLLAIGNNVFQFNRFGRLVQLRRAGRLSLNEEEQDSFLPGEVNIISPVGSAVVGHFLKQ